MEDHPYREGFTNPSFKCLTNKDEKNVLQEVHEGSTCHYLGWRDLDNKTQRIMYLWPTWTKMPLNMFRSSISVRDMGTYTSPHQRNECFILPLYAFLMGVDVMGPFNSRIVKIFNCCCRLLHKMDNDQSFGKYNRSQHIVFIQKKHFHKIWHPKGCYNQQLDVILK